MDIKSGEFKEKVKKIITRWVKLPHYRVFIFGSRVNGKAGIRSDIDIGIEAAKKIPGAAMVTMREELAELPIMQKIDLVDFKDVSANFRSVAMENMEVLYEQ
jgi:predicted nucleotidyltransferase